MLHMHRSLLWPWLCQLETWERASGICQLLLNAIEAVGFEISWHSLRTTYVSRSVELEQSPTVVMANTGDSPPTILKYYANLSKVVMRRFVESRPVIPSERVYKRNPGHSAAKLIDPFPP